MRSFPTRLLRASVLSALTGLALTGTALAADLRINLPADPAMVDPITYSELVAGDVIRQMYESFTAIDNDGKVVPALAESWEPLDGNLGFRVKLRQGVKFHSGREFTAKDVKFSYEQLLTPGNKAGLNAPYLDVIVGAAAVKDGSKTELEGVTIVDDHTVEIAFSKPDVLFPIYPIFMIDSGVVAESGADWASKVSAGTGPFKFAEWNRGQVVRLAAHPEYWRGAPKIEGVRFMIVPDAGTAMSMYETGELDVLSAATSLNRRILGDAAFRDQLLTKPAAQVRYLSMNSALYEPFKDKRVREAICLSLDQQEQIDGLYQGAAVRLNGQITEGVAGFNPDLPAIPYDPDKAKTLLAEAGFAGGAGLPPVKLTTIEPSKAQHLYFASKLDETLGFKTEVEILERGAMLAGMNSQQLPFFAWGWSAGYPDGLYFLEDLWYGPSAFNKGWKNADFDAIIEAAQMTADAEARYQMYHEAEKILLDDWGMCPLPVVMQVALVKPNVEGVAMTPFRLSPFWEVSITP